MLYLCHESGYEQEQLGLMPFKESDNQKRVEDPKR